MTTKRIVFVLLTISLFHIGAMAGSASSLTASEQVVEMTKNSVDDAVIVAFIVARKETFHLTSTDLIALKNAKASQSVQLAMAKHDSLLTGDSAKPASAESVLLGETEVDSSWQAETIPAKRYLGDFSAVRFLANENDIDISEITAHFEGGVRQHWPGKLHLLRGSPSRGLELLNSHLTLEAVEVTYRIVGNPSSTRASLLMFGIR